jgi:NNP family nitrate/nitrite transporter-like MFS transporter
MKYSFTREQRMLVVNGMLCFVLILLVLQFWLLTATMNAYLGGDQAVIWPATLASLVCLGLSVGLLQYLYALERPVERVVVGNPTQLTMATGTFVVCFAVFGSVSAMMPSLKEKLSLSDGKVSLALAIPVLLGSLGRIPLGVLSDRYGPRIVCIGVLIGTIIPGVLIGFVTNYALLLVCSFFIGVGLASFSGAVGLASGWYPPERQGAALGIYGMGNFGQSLASLGAPVVAAAMGFQWGFWMFALLALIWLVAFVALARDPRRAGPPKKTADFLLLLKESKTWILCLYYFLTFGGMVAMALYLPVLLTDKNLFDLDRIDAGFRTAGFVAVATIARPLGGMLADRYGGLRILLGVFPATALMALVTAAAVSIDGGSMVLFTLGALGKAVAIGLGNGAVFKLVPEYFPRSVGSVTGLVGAAGGLGGFFPPLVLGGIRSATGNYAWGFVLLAGFGLACLVPCWVSYSRAARPAALAEAA